MRVARSRELVADGATAGGGGARAAGQPAGALPDAEAEAAAAAAAGRRSGRRGDRRGRAAPTRPTATRMVAALASRELGRPVNRKRAQRVMRRAAADPAAPAARAAAAARLLPGRAARPALAPRHDARLGRRARLVLPERDDRLLHPRDRRLVARAALPRRRGDRARRAGRRPPAGSSRASLTLGTDNGSAFTSRRFRARLGELGITPPPRRLPRPREPGVHRDRWFGKLKERLVWRTEFETLDQAREGDRRLHRQLPPPPALRPPLPDPGRGAANLGGWTATSEIRGLKRQRPTGPGQTPPPRTRLSFRSPRVPRKHEAWPFLSCKQRLLLCRSAFRLPIPARWRRRGLPCPALARVDLRVCVLGSGVLVSGQTRSGTFRKPSVLRGRADGDPESTGPRSAANRVRPGRRVQPIGRGLVDRCGSAPPSRRCGRFVSVQGVRPAA